MRNMCNELKTKKDYRETFLYDFKQPPQDSHNGTIYEVTNFILVPEGIGTLQLVLTPQLGPAARQQKEEQGSLQHIPATNLIELSDKPFFILSFFLCFQ